MTKPYTTSDLSDLMDRDINWRLREFSEMKSAIRKADISAKPVLLRALITLLYGHWEGYVKYCSFIYFQHISLRKISYNSLKPQFYLNAFLIKIDSFFRSRASISDKCAFMNEILSSHNKRFSYINPSLIDTKSNLSSQVLIEICIVCDIDQTQFAGHEKFIDFFVLKRRNEIAHGEEVYIEENEIDNLIDKSISLMRLFRNLLENNVYNKSYIA